MKALSAPIAHFERAVDAVVSGDASALERALREYPELVRARSARTHHMYNGGCTTLGLVATSIHPKVAGVLQPLIDVLLARGARIEARGAGGGAHAGLMINSCLANGRPEAAAHLAARGAPLDIEGAAGIGRLDLVKSFLRSRRNAQGHRERRANERRLYVALRIWKDRRRRIPSRSRHERERTHAATQTDRLALGRVRRPHRDGESALKALAKARSERRVVQRNAARVESRDVRYRAERDCSEGDQRVSRRRLLRPAGPFAPSCRYKRPLFPELPDFELPPYAIVLSFGLVPIAREHGAIEIAPGTHRMRSTEAIGAVDAGQIVMRAVPLALGVAPPQLTLVRQPGARAGWAG